MKERAQAMKKKKRTFSFREILKCFSKADTEKVEAVEK